ncbi:MAG: XdhC family protein [Alphaproteobacteria bacterium]
MARLEAALEHHDLPRGSGPNAGPPALSDQFADDVVPFLAPGRALVSLVAIEGSAPRPLGAQMVVAPEGPPGEGIWGYLTGGCLEEAIVTEARSALRVGVPRRVRYGAGSPYRDLVLPCGSSIDLYFDVGLTDGVIRALIEARSERRAIATRTDMVGLGSARIMDQGPIPPAIGSEVRGTRLHDGVLTRVYGPPLQLLMAGAGPVPLHLAQLAAGAGLSARLLTQDQRTADLAGHLGMPVQRLTSPRLPVDLAADAQTAVVVLFHDHDWEPVILEAALATPAFYIGAMGSRRTHAARLDSLAARGVPADQAARIIGPVGVTGGARSAPEIAVSILTQILAEARSRAGAPSVSG